MNEIIMTENYRTYLANKVEKQLNELLFQDIDDWKVNPEEIVSKFLREIGHEKIADTYLQLIGE